MSLSPLQFAREFERLKSNIASDVADDSRLLDLIDFWQELESVRDKPTFNSYLVEYIQFVEACLTPTSLTDLPLEDLQRLLSITTILQLNAGTDMVTYRLAQVYCYVGEFKTALSVLLDQGSEKGQVGEFGEDIDSLRDREGLQLVCQRLKSIDSPACAILEDILSNWTGLSAELSHDRAYCLFVETGRQADARHGKLRLLTGSAELFAKSAATDEITFENQIKTPDDPFIGSSYNALKSLRELFVTQGYREKGIRYYHAHFNIVNSGQIFTGDSIGLGVAAVTFAGLMKSEIMRHERLVSQEVAFTGGVDETGCITPVNEKTLRQKIVRTFFSHIRYLVLPRVNLRAAEGIVRELTGAYPRRTLHLVAYERLADVLDDKNVIRSEKVCIGQYVARKAARVGRATRMQVPILLALLYVLISLLYPKAWIGFDNNPQYVHQTKTGFVALNADSVTLWEKKFECDSLRNSKTFAVGDLDGDGLNEVGYIPDAISTCEDGADIFLYDYRGQLLFQRDCSIQGEYPGDTSSHLLYRPAAVVFNNLPGRDYIVTSVVREYPARDHIRIWNTAGGCIGWYVDAGYGGGPNDIEAFTSHDQEYLLTIHTNNRMGCASFCAIRVDSSYGVAPPYTDSHYALENVRRGNQAAYLIFPRSDMSRTYTVSYNQSQHLSIQSDNLIRVDVAVAPTDTNSYFSYFISPDFRVVGVNWSDGFASRRNQLVAQGVLAPVSESEYLDEVLKRVTYWTDSGWVTEGALRAAEKSQ